MDTHGYLEPTSSQQPLVLMRMTKPPQPTTEEHRPPAAASDVTPGRPVLLAAFPALATIPIPPLGEKVGRAWLEAAGVADPEVSDRHLRFFHEGARLHVEDVGSRNGLYIGGVPVRAGERVALNDGDVLRLGRTLLVYREAFTGPEAPEPPLGGLVGPWGLTVLRKEIDSLDDRRERSKLNVLLQGETGTGKELLAEVVAQALRSGKPFVPVNVAGIPASTFEGQLFGWKKGSYTGAAEDNRGVLREHEGGSVFLDEIGELPLRLQPKLLRLLENREILPVGARRPVHVDVALIAATNQPLEGMVKERTFRRDLLARFLVRLEIPPLRDRPEDIFAVLQELRARLGHPFDPKRAEVEAVERLMLEMWPANVRDLDRLASAIDLKAPLRRHAVERVLGPPAARKQPSPEAEERTLAASDGNPSIARKRRGVSRGKQRKERGAASPATFPTGAAPGGNLKTQIDHLEKGLYEDAFSKANGNIAEMARNLGVSRSTAGRRVKLFGLKPQKR